MDKSFMATVYVIGIAVFFLVLVIMTIMFIVSKIKNRNEDLYEGDEYDEDEGEEDEEYEDAYEEDTTAFVNAYASAKYAEQDPEAFGEESEEAYEDEEAEDIKIPEIQFGVSDDTYVNTFDDSAFDDSAFDDSAFDDSAFGDSAFGDSAFGDSAFEDSAETVSQIMPDRGLTPEEQLARYQAETRAQMAQQEAKQASALHTTSEDSAFGDSAFGDSAFEDSAFGDSAFAQEEIAAAEAVQMTEDAATAQTDVEAKEPELTPEEQLAKYQAEAARERLARIQAETRAQLAQQEAERLAKAKQEAEEAARAKAFEEAASEDLKEDDKPVIPTKIEESATGMIDVAAGVTGMVKDVAGEAVDTVAGTAAGVAGVSAGAVTGGAAGMAVAAGAATADVAAKAKKASKKQEFKPAPSGAPSTDRFYWFNKNDVAARPSYKTEAMYYHYFEDVDEIIEDLLVEMYDNALVRTEEIRYIAYGIVPRAVSMKEILASGNAHYDSQARQKEPSTQDLINIYEKWCGYVEKLFGIIEFHADSYTVDQIHSMLCEFGKSDVDILIEGM